MLEKGPLTGAPLSQSGSGPVRVAPSATPGPVIPGNRYILCDTTAAPNNFLSLPPLESVAGGTTVTIKNISAVAAALTISAAGTEAIDGAGAPGVIVIPSGESRTFTSDRGQTSGMLVTIASWWTQST